MVETDKITENKIKRDGIFDFKELYRFCYTWLADDEYLMVEKNYTEKVKGDAKEIEIYWEAKKKISDYFRILLKISWRILNMVEVEVQKDGKKIKMQKGLVEIKTTGSLQKDYEHRWEDRPLFKFLRGVYDKYIIRGRIDQYEQKVIDTVDEFVAQVKSFLVISGER